MHNNNKYSTHTEAWVGRSVSNQREIQLSKERYRTLTLLNGRQVNRLNNRLIRLAENNVLLLKRVSLLGGSVVRKRSELILLESNKSKLFNCDQTNKQFRNFEIPDHVCRRLLPRSYIR